MLVMQTEALNRTHIPERAEVVIRVPGHKPIIVTVCSIIDGYKVKIGVQAEPDIEVNRGELDTRKHGYGESK